MKITKSKPRINCNLCLDANNLKPLRLKHHGHGEDESSPSHAGEDLDISSCSRKGRASYRRGSGTGWLSHGAGRIGHLDGTLVWRFRLRWHGGLGALSASRSWSRGWDGETSWKGDNGDNRLNGIVGFDGAAGLGGGSINGGSLRGSRTRSWSWSWSWSGSRSTTQAKIRAGGGSRA